MKIQTDIIVTIQTDRIWKHQTAIILKNQTDIIVTIRTDISATIQTDISLKNQAAKKTKHQTVIIANIQTDSADQSVFCIVRTHLAHVALMALTGTPKPDIFGAAATADTKNKEKRSKLKKIDQVATKAFDPFGISILNEASLEQVWAITKKGDKFANFYSELAATEAQGGNYRHGIAISRFAEVALVCLSELKSNENLRKCLKESVLDKAVKEGDELEVHLQRLNAGKGSQAGGEEKEDSFGGLKKRMAETPASNVGTPTMREINESAAQIFDWLQLGASSNFRMLLNLIADGGVFYGYQAADKVMRAWMQQEKIDKVVFTDAITARFVEAAPTAKRAKLEKEVPKGGLFD